MFITFILTVKASRYRNLRCSDLTSLLTSVTGSSQQLRRRCVHKCCYAYVKLTATIIITDDPTLTLKVVQMSQTFGCVGPWQVEAVASNNILYGFLLLPSQSFSSRSLYPTEPPWHIVWLFFCREKNWPRFQRMSGGWRVIKTAITDCTLN